MSTSANSTIEKAELDAVLQSGIFNRAPNLARFLTYVCEKHFEGKTELIKEYSIAVEALNRPAEFDQRKDSIVRVEAHRLRKRLAAYYQSEGARHSIQIQIPNGQYAPQFLRLNAASRFENATEVEPGAPTISIDSVAQTHIPAAPSLAVEANRSKRLWSPRLVLTMSAALAAVAVGFGVSHRARATAAASVTEVWQGSSTEPVPNEYRFLAGYSGVPFKDRQGRVWQPDAYYTGGTSRPIAADLSIEGLPDPRFGKTLREGTFSYAIPERQGAYELHLHFIAIKPRDPSDPASLLSFQVMVNAKPVLDALDPASEAGGFDRLHSRVVRDVSPASDGKIHLTFNAITGKSFISAVELLSSEPGKIRPVRIVAAKSSVTDSDGLLWMANEDSTGGVLVERNDSVRDPKLRALFVGEHYGNFSYHIPVPPGKYRVKLFFAETYFGSKLPFAGPALGARVFNVFANGFALLRDFDITKAAGGPNVPVIRQFDNLEPNAQGNIVLEFVPVRNYAEVNAIEISQMN